jgi:serine/threonine protein kinase
MAFRPEKDLEPIPGYKLVKRIGTGGYGEVWETTAPGGLTKAIKIIYGQMNEARAEQEHRALSRIREVRHPFLLSLERFEAIDDQLFIVTELADRSLQDRFEECRAQGLPGIPRDELIEYFRDAADALDYMNDQYRLQHLDIKPQNLLLVGGRIKIADFGLVKDLQGTSATATGGVTPIYASPEAFDGRISRSCDQYSLAIVYQEMLTAVRPFPGKSALQLAAQHMNSPPMLEALPPSDRPVIARALAKLPEQRFPTCREMIQALIRATGPATPVTPPPPAPALDNRTPVPRMPSSAPVLVLGDEKDILDCETIVGLDPPPSTPYTPSKAIKPAPEPLPEPPCPSAGPVRVRPTLFIGIGGLGGIALRRLRSQLHRRFQDVAHVPSIRFLLLETDRAGIRAAQHGTVNDGLTPDETMLLPLHRPEHYRAQSKELLRWLDRRWLYGIPRSCLTEGMRPLGRLALVENAAAVSGRLRAEFALLTSPEAKAQTVAATGAGLREETPRVFVVASIAGGTGGGMFVDIAYAVRRVLTELQVPSDGLTAILMHSRNGAATDGDLAAVNTYAALTELNHLSSRTGPTSADGPSQAPFNDCYVVDIGDESEGLPAAAAVEPVCQYLYLDTATSAGAAFDQYRRSTPAGSGDNGAGLLLRTLGVHHISFPRHALTDQATHTLCRKVVESWLIKEANNSVSDAVREDCLRQTAALGLDAETLTSRFYEVAQAVWGDAPTAVFQRVIEEWVAPDLSLTPTQAHELASRTLRKIDDLLGAGVEPGFRDGPTRSPVEVSLSEHEILFGGKLAHAVAAWLATNLDQPEGRLSAAEAAGRFLIRHLSSLAEVARSLLSEYRTQRMALRDRLALGDLTGKTGSRWLGVGKRQERVNPAEKFIELCRLRLKELVLQSTAEVFRTVTARVNQFQGELSLVNEKLRHLADALDSGGDLGATTDLTRPSVTELLPNQAPTLGGAAAAVLQQLGPHLLSAVDAAIQKDVLTPGGGLWQIATRTMDLTKALTDKLESQARTALLTALAPVDAAELLLQSLPNIAAAQKAIGFYVDAARPRNMPAGAWHQFMAAVPSGPAGKLVAELISRYVRDIPLTVVDSDGDVTFCYEAAQVPLGELCATLFEGETELVSLGRQLMTRIDVNWSELPLTLTG